MTKNDEYIKLYDELWYRVSDVMHEIYERELIAGMDEHELMAASLTCLSDMTSRFLRMNSANEIHYNMGIKAFHESLTMQKFKDER